MRIGDLKKRIELQKPTSASDGIGGYTKTYVSEHIVWAAIWPVSAKDQMQAGQMTGTITHRIRIRYNSELQSDWRIKYGDRYFAIMGPPVNQNEGNRILDLLCKEVET